MTLQTSAVAVVENWKQPVHIGLGLLAYGGPEEELVIYGLGSCIGLALWCPSKRFGVMGHIVMSDSRGAPVNMANPAKFADWAVPRAVEAMLSRGARRTELVAKIAGGAHTLGGALSNTIGALNTKVTISILESLKIPIVGNSVGGTVGRTMRFYPRTGRVHVRLVNGANEEL